MSATPTPRTEEISRYDTYAYRNIDQGFDFGYFLPSGASVDLVGLGYLARVLVVDYQTKEEIFTLVGSANGGNGFCEVMLNEDSEPVARINFSGTLRGANFANTKGVYYLILTPPNAAPDVLVLLGDIEFRG